MRILSLVPLSDDARGSIEAVDDEIELIVAPGTFDGELRETWGDVVADGYLRPGSEGTGTRAERDALLAAAEVVLAGFPVPVDLAARAPGLRWVHQTPAGASNLQGCDLWSSDVVITTSRGLGNTLAIAEYVIASFLHFGRELHRADRARADGRFDRRDYRPTLLAGATACVIGAGGIGQEVGRLCAALGMRVVGTRRTEPGSAPLPPGFADLGGPGRLIELVAEAGFVAVCCQWTPETDGLVGPDVLAAMPDDAVLVNVARGEVIDEAALVAELDRLRGVALDVYVGEFERPPDPALWHHPNVLMTPHTSAGAAQRSTRPIELFVQNLEALVNGGDMINVIDRGRGY